jgi:hypothetical protein
LRRYDFTEAGRPITVVLKRLEPGDYYHNTVSIDEGEENAPGVCDGLAEEEARRITVAEDGDWPTFDVTLPGRSLTRLCVSRAAAAGEGATWSGNCGNAEEEVDFVDSSSGACKDTLRHVIPVFEMTVTELILAFVGMLLLLIVLLLLCFCRKKADNGRVASGTWTERDDKAEGARGGAGGSAEGSYEKAVEMQDVVMKTDKVGLL